MHAHSAPSPASGARFTRHILHHMGRQGHKVGKAHFSSRIRQGRTGSAVTAFPRQKSLLHCAKLLHCSGPDEIVTLPLMPLVKHGGCSVVLRQAKDVVTGHNDHGSLVLAGLGRWGCCEFVCHEDAVHHALLLGDEVVAGARRQPAV